MGFLKLNGLKSLLTVMLSIGFALTVQADDDDKDKEIQGPTIEVCKSKKDGTEKCKTKELHGQKAIIFLHQEQQRQAGVIEVNENAISGLSTEVEGLSGEIEAVRSEIPDDQQIIEAALSDPLISGAIEAIPQLSERIDELEVRVETVKSTISGLKDRVAILEGYHSPTVFLPKIRVAQGNDLKQSSPWITIGHLGIVYVGLSDKREGGFNSYVFNSAHDNGNTWGSGVRVSDRSGAHHGNPPILNSNPETGAIYAIYRIFNNQEYFSVSHDQGVSWTPDLSMGSGAQDCRSDAVVDSSGRIHHACGEPGSHCLFFLGEYPFEQRSY